MNIVPVIRRFWFLLLGLMNAFFIGLMLWSALSDRILPIFPYLSVYIGMIFPFFVVVNSGFFVYWLLSPRKWGALASLAALAIVIPKILLYCPIHPFADAPPKGAIKVMTYNVYYFNGCSKSHGLEKTFPFLVKSDADIIMMQEFGWSDKSKHLLKADILKALAAYPYHRIVELNEERDGWHIGGMAVFSKYPLSKEEKIDLSSSFNGAMKCHVTIDGRDIAIYNLHLESNKLTEEDQRNFSSLFDNPDKGRIRTIGGKLAAKYGLGSSMRANQADLLAVKIAQEKGLVIVGGDFNDIPLSYTYRTVRGNLNDSFADTGTGVGISFNRNRFYFRIDHLLYSDGLTPYQAKIDNVRYSDHYPLISYFTID